MKKLVCLSALLMMPTAFSAEAVTNNVVIYGKAIGAIQNLNGAARGERAFYPADESTNGSSTEVNDLYSRIGFKGEEKLGGGLKAFWVVETGLALDSGDATFHVGQNGFANREGWVGLDSEQFGSFKLGRGKSPYTLAAEYYDNLFSSHTFSSANFGDGYYALGTGYRPSNTAWYTSPSFLGAKVDLAYFTAENKDANGLNSQGISTRLFGMWGNFDAQLAYQKSDDYDGVDGQELEKYILGGSVYLGALNLGAQYSENKLTGAPSNKKVKAATVFAAYDFGELATLRGAYVNQKVDGGKDGDVFNIGLQYNFSKRSYALAEYYMKNVQDSGDPQVASIGLGHNF